MASRALLSLRQTTFVRLSAQRSRSSGNVCHRAATTRASRLFVLAQAKANKAKKGGKQQKTSALDKLMKAKEDSENQDATTAESADSSSESKSPDVMMLLLVLVNSYWQSTKQYLMEDVDFEQLADELFKAPFGLVATDKYDNPEPVVTYANQAALRTWEATWTEFVGTSSSKFAVDAQDSFLAPASSSSSQSPYNGWVTTTSGVKVKIRNGLLFDVKSPGGELLGQALKFVEVEREDGSVVRLDEPEAGSKGGDSGPSAAEGSGAGAGDNGGPTQEEVEAAQAAVQRQADVVRGLKEGKGLTNQDEEVQEAVAVLLELKEKAAALQKRL